MTGRRRGVLAAFLVIALLLPAAAVQGAEWRLEGLDGGKLDASDLAQGSTVLVVWAGWSPRCREIVAEVNRLVEKWGGQARVVTIDFQEKPEEVRAFLRGKRLAAAVFLDTEGAFSRAHEISTLPGLVVYKDGQMTHRGRLPSDPDAAIERALR
jgi:thiol-disulfide isomerase/thioredoxin